MLAFIQLFSYMLQRGRVDLIPESNLGLAFGLSNNFYLKAKLFDSLKITLLKRLLLQ